MNPATRHRSRDRFAGRFPCHVTLKVQAGLPSLRRRRVVSEIERSLEAGCERGSFRVVHYSIQADHGHFLVEAAGREALGRGMKSLAARFARAVNRTLERSGPVLADRYHVRVLRSPRQVRNALAYVLLNVRRHVAQRRGRGALRAAALDPASSARWFEGWTGRCAGPALGPRSVALPHTWLVKAGWRRHGLISPSEVPGGG
jgi:REP element-mobilizing transposase RayT